MLHAIGAIPQRRLLDGVEAHGGISLLDFFTRLAPQRDAVGHPGALEVVPQLPFLELAHVELVELLVRQLGEGGDLRAFVGGVTATFRARRGDGVGISVPKRSDGPESGRGSTHVR